MSNEAWRPIEGFSDYEVSDLGRVRSKSRPVHNYTKPGRVLTPSARRNQYGRITHYVVNLGRGNMRRVHHLVLETFIGPCPPGLEGCHNDGAPGNNRLSNLRWDTHAANMQDVKRHGTHFTPFADARGETHHNTTLTAEDVRLIRSTDTGPRGAGAALARRFNVSAVTIGRIIDRKVWTHI